MTNRERLFLFVPFICCQVASLAAQGTENYEEIRAGKRVAAVRINEKIVIDGHLGEEVWQRAEPASSTSK